METETAFTRAGYFDNPYLQLAAAGDFTFDRLIGASNPAYLAQTDEVRMTDAIRAKAAELDNDPVKIYYWVRNNVEWLPTWGAIQDADITLGSRRGNAIDISSLLIALYRAAGIPARYVHGAIEVPVDQFNNWTGNFTDTQAALSFASAGGIPLRLFTLTEGTTTTTTVRMEHMWVEAALDYFPSRAAINKDADSWIKLDASFKQYEEISAVDLIAISGLEPDAVNQSFIDSGTVNLAEGWAQGFDASILQAAQIQMQSSIESYVESLQDPRVADVIGGRRTLIEEHPAIPSDIEVKVLAIGARYGVIPDQLAPTITFAFSTDILGSPIDPITFRWSALNNRKVTLSFRPATQEDQDALDSLVPPDAQGPLDLPSAIPSYLIDVVPELKVENLVVKTGKALTLGEELLLYNRISEPNRSDSVDQRSVVVGSYLSFAVVGGSVSHNAVSEARIRYGLLKQALETGERESLSEFDREDLIGDIYYAGNLGYFAEYLLLGSFMLRARGGMFGLPLSAGVFGYEPSVSTFFGIPRGIEEGWASMDLHHIARNYSIPNSTNTEWIGLGQALGAISSALENAIPEQIFFDQEENPAKGVSAITALSDALAGGQRIYTVNGSNIDNVIDTINLDESSKSEVVAYVNAGFEATVHEQPITVTGWRGSGYILMNSASGEASYKVSGGKNGDFQSIAGWILSILFYLDSDFSKPYFELSKTARFAAGLVAVLVGIEAIAELNEDCGLPAAVILGVIIGWISWIISSAAFFLALGLMLSFVWTAILLVLATHLIDIMIIGAIGFAGALCHLFSVRVRFYGGSYARHSV